MSISLNRREFLLATGLLAAFGSCDNESVASADDVPFQHGVASGDPLHDRVLLWTRVTPPTFFADAIDVNWLVALDARLTRIVARGRSVARPDRDHTVKVDVGGLTPGTTYYYRFDVRGACSPVGRTRTLPAGHVDHTRLAFLSCANLSAGHFNVYALVAARNDLDAVLHLGDYLYEMDDGAHGSPIDPRRVSLRQRELLSLDDYRRRHAQYKRNADLQAVHRQHPFICIWDDHEVANDAWQHGAANHNPDAGEGEWTMRKHAALRAYMEWMPIREQPAPGEPRIYRAFRFGNLADLAMLDTRHIGRDRQSRARRLSNGDFDARDPLAIDPTRTLLGFDQERWLDDQLRRSQARGASWRLLGQQVMMAQLSTDGGRSVMNLDQWDGYAAARERLFTTLRDGRIDNLVVMTGDAHASFAAELRSDPWQQGDALGVEFVTPAVTSPGIQDLVTATDRTVRLRAGSPHLRFVDLQQRGYGLLDVTHARVQGEIWHVDTVAEPSSREALAAAFVCASGESQLQVATAASEPGVSAEPAP